MKAIFDVGHPAHVHLFKNTIMNLLKSGWKVKIVARPKEITLELLEAYGFQYDKLRHYIGTFNKAIGMFRIDFQYLKIAYHFSPDVLISAGSPYSAHISRIISRPHLAFTDTPLGKGTFPYLIFKLLFRPFTKVICTPSVLPIGKKYKKNVKYNGYHELAYLHPNYFKPDPSVLKQIGLTKEDTFIIMRFAAWDALHDIGHKGYKNIRERIEFVNKLEEYCRVFITSEIKIPELRKYEIPIAPENIHNLLAFSTMYIGEGATMASEAGVLGVPWIFLYDKTFPNLDDQEKNYGLGVTVHNASKAFEIATELLKRKNLKEEWKMKRERLLNDKIDVTHFMTEFIRGYPKSLYEYRLKHWDICSTGPVS